MLQITIAILYITFLCWTYGYITLQVFTNFKVTEKKLPVFTIVCMTGLSSIAVIAAILSLFIPLGGIAVQAGFLLGGTAYWLVDRNIRRNLGASLRKSAGAYNLFSLLLLVIIFTLLLVMGSWTITHPDTIGYHAQTIQWIKNYKVIPGLVHLHVRYGLQNYWYLLSALFSFGFTHTTALTFLNTALLCWFVIFVIEKINGGFQQANDHECNNLFSAILFFLLLAISFWDFGQMRLTAVSASPDFAAGIYVGLVYYLMVHSKRERNEEVSLMLAFFFSILAITIKLSSVPILLLSLYIFSRLFMQKKKKILPCLVVLAFLVIGPFFTRNFITSGYAVFPSAFPDVGHFDWKLDKNRTEDIAAYVTNYARTGELANMGKQQPANLNKLPGWLPVWWRNRSVAEKTMLVSLFMLLVLGLLFIRRIIRQSSTELRFLLCVSLAGLIFWFVRAPDPRFGIGFIIPVQGMLLYLFAGNYPLHGRTGRRFLRGGITCMIILIGCYTVYRFFFYFHAKNLVAPEGVPSIAYKEIKYQGIIMYVPYDNCDCGSTPLPCVYFDNPFLLRGTKVTDGFKPVK